MDEERRKQLDELLARNGMKPPDMDSLQYHTGDTRRSDYEFYMQIKAAEAQREKLEGAAKAGDIYDVAAWTVSALKPPDHDHLDDYMLSRLPSADSSNHLKNTAMDNNTEKFTENRTDLTGSKDTAAHDSEDTGESWLKPGEDSSGEVYDSEDLEESSAEKFSENRTDATDDVREKSDIREEFNDNKTDITGNDSKDDDPDRHTLDYKPGM